MNPSLLSTTVSTDLNAVESRMEPDSQALSTSFDPDQSQFRQIVSDMNSTPASSQGMKELAVAVQDASAQSGEGSPLSAGSSDISELLGNEDQEALISFLMVNAASDPAVEASEAAGTATPVIGLENGLLPADSGFVELAPDPAVTGMEIEPVGELISSEDIPDPLLTDESLMVSDETDLEPELQSAILDADVGAVEPSSDMSLNNDAMASVAANAGLSKAEAAAASKLTGENTAANATGAQTIADEAVKTSANLAAEASDADLDSALSKPSSEVKESVKNADLTNSMKLAQQTAAESSADELTDTAPDRNLKTALESVQSSSVRNRSQSNTEVQNMQMAENMNRPMKLANAASALSERIQTMIGSNTQSALVRLDPPELGSMEVRVQVRNEQTHVQIVTNSQQTREALEQQSARLREALGEQGVNLSNLDVSDQQTQGRGDGEGGHGSSGQSGHGSHASDQTEQLETLVSAPLGFVDQYV